MNFSSARFVITFVMTVALFLTSACTSGEPTGVNTQAANFTGLPLYSQRPIRDDVIYFMVTDRFNNADPGNDRGGVTGDRLVHGYDPADEKFYHGGDLKGVTAKLDYLADMGVTAIWMTPVFKNKWVMEHDGWLTASYHGYWIADFTRVDPHLGTDAELRELIEEAHKRNIKIIFDIVINHTADTIKYRQCHDTDYEGADKEAAGSGCIFRPSDIYPYTTRGKAEGTPINTGFLGHDEAHQTESNFAKLVDPSFAYTPFVAETEKSLKKPDWLNNPIYYHNRGEIVYSGEAFYLGDFYGLDDTFTEHPDVVHGMIDIYQYWIREYGIDGFRIDTAGHVNTSFWAQFIPAMQEHAKLHGRPEFFMFGEVINSVLNKRDYITKGNLPALLDFDFKHAVADYVAGSGSAKEFVGQFLNTDDYFIDHDTSPYTLPTFLSNHDDGRFGVQLNLKDPDAPEQVKLKRTRLAHAIMYFARGVPILYYGDEQGFMGEPGFHESREDMLPSASKVFNDNDLIGTDLTTADANFDTQHPMYVFLKDLGSIYRQHPALRHGDQHVRYADEQEGIIAWSRIDPKERVEYLAVFNNSQTEKQADIPVFSRDADWSHITGSGRSLSTRSSSVSVLIPPLEYLVLKAEKKIAVRETAPRLSFTNLQNNEELQCSGFVEVKLDEDVLSQIKFDIKQKSGNWKNLGTDTNKPYRIYIDTVDYTAGEILSLRATTAAYSTATNSVTIKFKNSSANRNCE